MVSWVCAVRSESRGSVAPRNHSMKNQRRMAEVIMPKGRLLELTCSSCALGFVGVVVVGRIHPDGQSFAVAQVESLESNGHAAAIEDHVDGLSEY